jgi:NAD(P)-dependent dehydrogenase (short-subunit alcohol dehydrogenase family)
MAEKDLALSERLRLMTEWLENVGANPALLSELTKPELRRLRDAAGGVYAPDIGQRRRLAKAKKQQRKKDRVQLVERQLHETGIRQLRRKPVFTTPNAIAPESDEQQTVPDPDFREAIEPQNCYVCKHDYNSIHHFYDQLCPTCAELNFRKRTETTDLRGRVALLTGGRVKIGYQAGLKLLRAGSELIVSTRFPRDSALRYASEPDFSDWSHRLEIFGLDLRHTPSVEAFCKHLLATRSRLDFIINNACQTIRRPPDFYQHMMANEKAALDRLPAPVKKLLGAPVLTDAPSLSQIPLLPGELVPQNALFPQGRLDQDLQQIDLRQQNSWRLTLAEVPAIELLEVQLVNAVAPFLFNARLKPLMLRTPERDKHIVNIPTWPKPR